MSGWVPQSRAWKEKSLGILWLSDSKPRCSNRAAEHTRTLWLTDTSCVSQDVGGELRA